MYLHVHMNINIYIYIYIFIHTHRNPMHITSSSPPLFIEANLQEWFSSFGDDIQDIAT